MPTAPSVNDVNAVAGTATRVTLPVGSGGDGTLTYSVSTLPTGWSFNANTRVLSGTTSIVEGTTTITYTVTDADGDTDDSTFDIIVAGPPLALTDFVSTGLSMDMLALLSVSGDPGTIRVLYRDSNRGGTDTPLGGELGIGTAQTLITQLRWDTNTNVLIFNDNDTPGATDLGTYFGAGGAGRDLTFYFQTKDDGVSSFTVADNLQSAGGNFLRLTPPSALQTILDQLAKDERFIIGFGRTAPPPDLMPTAPAVSDVNAVAGTATRVTLPEGSGGDGTLTYSVSVLPTGWSFNANTRVLSGSTSIVAGTTTITYTVTDSDGDTDDSTFDIIVAAAPPPDLMPTAPAVSDVNAVAGTAIQVTLPVGTGGDGPLAYSVSQLPTGWTFNANTRVLSGSTSIVAGTTTITYTVTDSDGDTDDSTFDIIVAAAPPPDLMPTAPAVSDVNAVAGTAIQVTLPVGTGGDGPLAYSVSQLPTGWTFNENTRVLSGSTSIVRGTTTITYTVTDNDGDTDDSTFDIIVAAAPPPPTSLSLPAIRNFTAIVGQPFSIKIPPATGGTGTLVYTATGVPAGLVFNPLIQVLAGSPTTAGEFMVTVEVTDAASETDRQTFSIAVAEDTAEEEGWVPWPHTGAATKALIVGPEASKRYKARIRSIRPGALPSSWVESNAEETDGETPQQYLEGYWIGPNDRVGDLPAIPAASDAQKTNKSYLPSIGGQQMGLAPGVPTEARPALWLLTRHWSTEVALATDWQYARRLSVRGEIPQQFLEAYWIGPNDRVGDLPAIPEATDVDKVNKSYLPSIGGQQMGFAPGVTTAQRPALWLLTRHWSTEVELTTDWQYARRLSVRGEIPQQFLEGYWIGPNDRVGDLPAIPAASDAQKTNKSYLPTIGGQKMGLAPGVPTEARPALWLLTRHWSTEAELTTDWQYARRLSVRGETPQQFLEGYWIGPNDRVGDLPGIPAATDAQKTNKSYLPTIDGQRMGLAPGVPTEARPALWLLTRHWSTEVELTTDWQYARRLSVRGETPQQFLEGYWIGPNDRVGDLPAIPAATDAQKTNKSYLPTIGGQQMGLAPGVPTEARPALWLLTRHWSTEVALATDWQYARRLSVHGEIPQQFLEGYWIGPNDRVGDLPAIPAANDAQKINKSYLPSIGGQQMGLVPGVTTAERPALWLLTRHWSTEVALTTDWQYARRLSVHGEIPQQFLEGYWIGPDDRVGDLPAIPAANDAQKINKAYLPTIDGKAMSAEPEATTVARPALWLLTRHWSTEIGLTTDWQYARRLTVQEPVITGDAFLFGDPEIPFMVKDQEIDTTTPFQLPTATKNGAAIPSAEARYDVLGGLPAGLFYNEVSRRITRTPTVAGVFSLLYRVTDGRDGSVGHVRFEFEVAEERVAAEIIRPVIKPAETVRAEINKQFSFNLPRATISSGEGLEYVLDGPLSDGLVFSSGSVVLSGTPTRRGGIGGATYALIARVASDNSRFAICLVNVNIYNPQAETDDIPTQ